MVCVCVYVCVHVYVCVCVCVCVFLKGWYTGTAPPPFNFKVYIEVHCLLFFSNVDQMACTIDVPLHTHVY